MAFLRTRVRALGWEQWWMAERLGVNPRTVSRWLSGKTSRIRARHLTALAKLLAIDRRFLVHEPASSADEGNVLKNATTAVLDDNLTELLTPTGHLATAEAVLRALLVGDVAVRDRASLLVQLAMALFRQGKYSASLSASIEALEIAEQIDDLSIRLRATMMIGHHRFAAGDLGACIDTYRQCLASAHEMGDQLNIAANSSNLGDVLRDYGAFEEARDLINDAIERYHRLDRPLNESIARVHLCELEFEVGSIAACREALSALDAISLLANHAYGKHRHAMFSQELEAMESSSECALAPLFANLAKLKDGAPLAAEVTTTLHAARIFRRAGLLDEAAAELAKADALALTQPVLWAHIALEWSLVAPTSEWPQTAIARMRHVGAMARVT